MPVPVAETVEGGTSIITAVTEVFTSLGNWIIETLPNITSVFYNSTTGLTFLGTLAVCGLAISVFFLLMGLIQNFLHFRG